MLNETNTSADIVDIASHEAHKYGSLNYTDDEVGWFYYKDEWRALQPALKLLYSVLGKRGIESPLTMVVSTFVAYYSYVTFFTICDFYGQNWHWIRKYKIQNESVSKKAVIKAVKLTLWNQLLYITPIWMIEYVTDEPKMKPYPLAPTLAEFLFQFFTIFVMFDFLYYFWHRWHHKNRRLYKWCHIVHHEFHGLQAWSAQYLHPWELFCDGVFMGVVPTFFEPHWLTMLIYMHYLVFESIVVHSGYDFPFDLNNLIPVLGPLLYGGARKHEMHHMKPYTNYQPYFATFDKLMGDECPGMKPGGIKPKELIEYEKNREKKQLDWYKSMPVMDIEEDEK